MFFIRAISASATNPTYIQVCLIRFDSESGRWKVVRRSPTHYKRGTPEAAEAMVAAAARNNCPIMSDPKFRINTTMSPECFTVDTPAQNQDGSGV